MNEPWGVTIILVNQKDEQLSYLQLSIALWARLASRGELSSLMILDRTGARSVSGHLRECRADIPT
jgi:hypothetical protein